jgi:hypothetical protein
MKIKAAVLHEMGKPAPYAESRLLVIEELELEQPGEGVTGLARGALVEIDMIAKRAQTVGSETPNPDKEPA